MGFPLTYEEVREMVRKTALNTSTARAIARKAGLMQGSGGSSLPPGGDPGEWLRILPDGSVGWADGDWRNHLRAPSEVLMRHDPRPRSIFPDSSVHSLYYGTVTGAALYDPYPSPAYPAITLADLSEISEVYIAGDWLTVETDPAFIRAEASNDAGASWGVLSEVDLSTTGHTFWSPIDQGYMHEDVRLKFTVELPDAATEFSVRHLTLVGR